MTLVAKRLKPALNEGFMEKPNHVARYGQ